MHFFYLSFNVLRLKEKIVLQIFAHRKDNLAFIILLHAFVANWRYQIFKNHYFICLNNSDFCFFPQPLYYIDYFH